MWGGLCESLLWQERCAVGYRHKGSAVSSEEYLFACMRYIELRLVRVGMVRHTANIAGRLCTEYGWRDWGLADTPSGCRDLGATAEKRDFAYRELFRVVLAP